MRMGKNEAIRCGVENPPVEDKKPIHDEITALTAQYLAQGGEIHRVEIGMSAARLGPKKRVVDYLYERERAKRGTK